VSQSNIRDLQNDLVAELREFETNAIRQGVSEQQSRVASYALCSLLDETVLNTPWGAQSDWGHHSLLVLFHKEAFGGDRFFELLKHLVQQPAHNLHLLEFYFLCLSLGFQGRYRISNNGANALEQIRSELFNLIQRVRGDFEPALSLRWEGLKDLRPALIRYVPLWVVGAAAAALLALIYVGFLLGVNAASDPIFSRINALSSEPVVPPEPNLTQPPVMVTERFKPLLAAEIHQGLVEVPNDRILRIYNSFASGSDRVKPEFAPMLRAIAAELEAGGGDVLVSGHTDDRPIRSVRFPSNFDLSTARAKNVANMLLQSANLSGRVRYEGRADSESLVPNDSPAHRAMNRRVDLLIR
jgi:type VI secretion system protein ImpK